MSMRKLFLFLIITIYFSCSHAEPILYSFQGKKIPFSSLKGKWIFINYWASWCQPCLDEIQHLNQFYQKNNEHMALFAVNFDHLSPEAQQVLIKQLHIQYPSLSQDPGSTLGLGDIRGVPATFVFTPNGKWVDTLYGGQTMASLSESLTRKYRD